MIRGWLARKLPAIPRRIGLKDVDIQASTILVRDFEVADMLFGLTSAANVAAAEVLSLAEANRWVDDLYHEASSGSFFAAITCG